ncbi:hypothetical protein ROHU_029004 [Labeo rohita]|uniref:chitin synthase n=1 Tax=Labeo rohita TaxID=84645 RepID=A0A498M154_LABRO|nr:hypothetical protein ROHU_029004 [Labeo rohita]
MEVHFQEWIHALGKISSFGFVLFVINYLVFESSLETKISVGLAIVGAICVSVNWWENYSTLFAGSFLEDISRDIAQSRNVVCIISSLIRILVTSAVVAAYVPLSGQEWKSVKLVFETVVVSLVAIQLISSALCHWFAVVACKMHALRRCFILPMYLASITVLAVFLVPVMVRLPESNQNFTCLENFQPESSDEWLRLMLNDAIKTLNARDIVVHMKIGGLACLGCSALSWWLGLVLSTVYVWYLKIHRIERTQDLFVRRTYEGAFMEQSMLLNARFEIRKKIKNLSPKETIKVFLCATMWHETYDEMMKIIISMFRLDKYRPKTMEQSNVKNDVEFEFHIYFDDAFKNVDNRRHANEYAEILVDIMYMYYILGWRLNRQYFKEFEESKELDTLNERLKKESENTYVLALDGDTDFQPAAVMLLIDRLKLYPEVGAACGRIHPTGTGEDRWLCTLMLQQGWRVEYNAASDAYTNAPQDFKEFYNQRRRWGPSTMANTIDLLGSGELTSQKNSSISKPYILYQIISMAASILGPATVCLMISGSFVFIFKMDKNVALVLAIVPPTVYLILCFKLKSDTQITIAAIMSTLYAFLMAGTILSIIGNHFDFIFSFFLPNINIFPIHTIRVIFERN